MASPYDAILAQITQPKGYDFSNSKALSSNNAPLPTDWINAFVNSSLATPKSVKESKPPLWRQMLGTLSGSGSAVTDQIYDIIKGEKTKFNNLKNGTIDWKQMLNPLNANPLAKLGIDQGINAVKGQWNQWLHGDKGLHYNDIPILGTLNLLTQNSKHGSDILGELGAKNELAKTIGGLGIDILADPATWFTGGASAAMKTAGKAAALGAAKDLGVAVAKTPIKMRIPFTKFGITHKGWDVGNVADQVAEEMAQRTASKFGDLAPTQSVLDDTAKAYRAKVLDAVSQARAKHQDALFSFGAPFGKKVGVGTKPEWLQRMVGTTAKPIGAVGAAHVETTLDKLGIDDADKAVFIKSVYGIENPSQMTEEMFKHFMKNYSGYEHVAENVDNALGKTIPAERINWGDLNADPNVNLGSTPFMENYLADVKPTQSSEVLKNLTTPNKPYIPSEVTKRSIAPSMFNARTLGATEKVGDKLVQNHYVNESANAIQDSHTKHIGQMQQLDNEKKALDKFVKENNVTDADMKAAQYLSENKAPKGYVPSAERAKVVEDLAKMVKPILDRIGEQGLASGVLDHTRPNYFPHVTKEGVKKGEYIPKPLSGQSEVSGFSLKRKSFDTLADLDNYVSGLRKEAKAAELSGDAEKADELTKEADEVDDLFERDTVKATYERAREGIKKNAMKELHNKLRDKGLLLKGNAKNNKYHKASEYVTIGGEDAGKLGAKKLENGKYETISIQKDVYEGLKRIDKLFEGDRLNQVVETAQTITNVWKSLVTTAVPSHFWNNFIGNIFNNALAGVRPKDYSAAMNLMKGFKDNTLDAKGMKLMQEAIDHGAFGMGFTSEFKRFVGEVPTKLEKVAEYERKLHAFMNRTYWAKAGLYGENVTRLANFLNGKATLGSAEKAAQQVRTHLFAYHEMTREDRVARLAVPFWNWTKRNLPLQFANFFKNTRIYQNFARVKETWDKETGADNPDYAKYRMWKIPGTDIGIPLNLPLNDLDMFTTSPTEGIRKAFATGTPLLKIPTELGLNKQFFTNKPIDDSASPYGGNVGTNAAIKYLISQLGGVSKAVNVFDDSDKTPAWQDLLGLIAGKPFDYRR